MNRVTVTQESGYVRRLSSHHPRYAVDGEEDESLPREWDFLRVLLIGAGGLGCELLQLMAMSGFADLTIIDMDTIELSNLNRQFLFREKDIGRSKSEVAAAYVSARCPGVLVTPIFGRIEDQSDDFYRGFDLIIEGVDSIQARRWISAKVAELAVWEVGRRAPSPTEAAAVASEEGEEDTLEYRISEAIPFIDTGTEGFEGHCRLFNLSAGPHRTPCQECVMWTFVANAKQVPLCTLESTPRAPEHCVLYAKLKLWEDAHRDDGLEIDPDNVEHVRWLSAKARERQLSYGIGGTVIDDAFTLGVIKNIVPAVGFTNAFVSGQAVTEAVKLAMGVARALQNCTSYNGSASAGGVFFSCSRLEADPQCPVCGPKPIVAMKASMRVRELVAAAYRRTQRHHPQTASVEEMLADATVSFVFPPTVVPTSGDAPAADPTPRMQSQREVFLAFNSRNPMRVAISGDTVEEIIGEAVGGAALLDEWKKGRLLPTLRVSADKTVITALVRYAP